MAPDAGNIKVVVRVRPFNSREKDRQAKCIVSMKENQTVLTPPSDAKQAGKAVKAALEGTKTFAFDKSYWSFERSDGHFAGQSDVFDDLGKPLLDNAFQGYNNCIFAYGQTGSGKSYSMMGYGEEQGVIPRICKDMFDRISDMHSKEKGLTSTVEVSYLEIYNERVRDLLNPANKGNLKVREHPATGPYVEDLAKLVVRDFAEIDHLMDEGNKARTVAATNMNETSSRSHAVFTLTLTQKKHDDETNMDSEKVAKISLVDLAGSERATSTGATGARLKEGAEINRSLSTLGRVIAALADLSDPKHKKTKVQVPYRDSVLTWLLKDSLGGNSLTAMIAAISPADINFEETLSTLRYADSAKRIKNHAVVNEDPNARMIRELKEELAQLRSKLGGGAGGIAAGGTGAVEEQYAPGTPLDQQFVSISNADGTVKRVSKAEIAEQLSQSEKLYADLNQTWEEKLVTTQKVHKEREAALEELGISIEKGNVGLSTPKKMPHLVNLSDDPLLAECLVYNLKPGSTVVGNMEGQQNAMSPKATNGDYEDANEGNTLERSKSQAHPDIMLNGSKILREHCVFENVDGVITLIPREGAAIMVNGIRIEAPKRLRSGYRLILGDFHIFRFNHPQETREEREAGEQERGSLLKYSVTADELGDEMETPTRKRPGLGHERTSSGFMSDIDSELPSGAVSPAPWRGSYGGGNSRDSDWAFARREAASTMLGSLAGKGDIASMTDDELDVLFDDVQRVRAGRKARPESRIFGSDMNGNDTDTESVVSDRDRWKRDKYLSNGTLDNFSLDTALTIPGTPPMHQLSSGAESEREELQNQLEGKKEEFERQLREKEEGAVEIEELRREKVKMESDLAEMKAEMEKQLQEHKKQVAQLKESSRSRTRRSTARVVRKGGLTPDEVFLAKWVLEHWRSQRYVCMAADVLRNASSLKEAQVLSQLLGREVVFQFTVADVGHTLGSSYDMVLNGIGSDEENSDTDLDEAKKPCIAVRLIDFRHGLVHLWSIAKLHERLKTMRQLQNHMDRGPEVTQHFRIESAFDEPGGMPHYSRVGDADIPLAAVFECRVQDFSLDVVSPYTCSVIGIVRLSLEPSSAEAPRETLKFNVVMHELVGFAEREGTSVHAQLFIPGLQGAEEGATTTAIIEGFGESAVRFESVHSMSLPLSAPREASLRVSVFAKVSDVHLDKLLSWDDMRDSSEPKEASKRPNMARHGSRLPESAFITDEKHDVFARMQVLEIGEDGEYAPVEVVQASTLDQGAHQLHQGLQRRISLSLVHSSGDSMPWQDVTGFCAGSVKLLDEAGKVQDVIDSNQSDVTLPQIAPPVIRTNEDGTTSVKLTAQWDSSAHASALLDRPTLDTRKTQLTLRWAVSSARVSQPMKFSFDIAVQTRPRAWLRQSSLLAQLWHNQRVVRSTANNYSIVLKPGAAKRAGDLWRMDTGDEYVTGEECLSGWAPRGISLVRDFIGLRSKQRRIREIEAAKGMLVGMGVFDTPNLNGDTHAQDEDDMDERQKTLLEKYADLWQDRTPSAADILLLQSQSGRTSPSPHRPRSRRLTKGSMSNVHQTPSRLAATITHHPKSPLLLKAGWLLVPDSTSTRWIRRYVELRRPYLHLYSGEGDEVGAIELSNARIDSEPEVGRLLKREKVRMSVWAVYARERAWVFACRNASERGEWIWGVDRGIEGVGGEEGEEEV